MIKTRANLDKARGEMYRKLIRWEKTLNQFPLLFQALENMEVVPNFDFDGDLALRFTGPSEMMHKVWKHLRLAGWTPSSRPGAEDITKFGCFWSAPEGLEGLTSIWMSWSNSVCKIKYVGTKTVQREEAVYEVDCGEQTPLGELLGAENDNPSVREG